MVGDLIFFSDFKGFFNILLISTYEEDLLVLRFYGLLGDIWVDPSLDSAVLLFPEFSEFNDNYEFVILLLNILKLSFYGCKMLWARSGKIIF